MKYKNFLIIFIIVAVFLGIRVLTKSPTSINTVSDSNSDPENPSTFVENTPNSEISVFAPKSTPKDNEPPISNKLDLTYQELTQLPKYVLARTDLVELDISYNSLGGALPSEIGKLKKLKVLNASNNLMTGVPAEIGSLSALEILDLSHNELTGLPNELGKLKNLKILNLSGNNYSQQDLDVIKKGLSPNVNIIL